MRRSLPLSAAKPLSFFWLSATVIGLLVGGCPQSPAPSTLAARITLIPESGPAPLTVSFSAAQSTAGGAEIAAHEWDFGGAGGSTAISPTFRFERPGRYDVRLTITDADGNSATARVDVRVAGPGALAAISASPSEGDAPLRVQFDGRDSRATDDVIFDYFWDFGDGGDSRLAAPIHRYNAPGIFTCTLRVVSAGGVEATTTTTITVRRAPASQPASQPSSQPASQPAP